MLRKKKKKGKTPNPNPGQGSGIYSCPDCNDTTVIHTTGHTKTLA